MLKILKYILKQLARLTIWRYKPDIIAVTGSVGKTSAKEAIYVALRNNRRARKSSGNLNNELGAPLAILGDWKEKDLELISLWQPAGTKKTKKFLFWLKATLFSLARTIFMPKFFYPQTLILEYGASKPGDIKKLVKIAKPKIGVITAIGETPVHLEFYSGPEAVAREKAKLIEPLSVNDFAVLNFDDRRIAEIKHRTRAKIMTFGFNEGADVRIANFENCFSEKEYRGVNFKIEYQGNVVPITIKNTFGRAQAYAAGAAVCVGLIYRLNLVELSESLSRDYKSAKHRMNLIDGAKGELIIDDCYNASPLSMESALGALADIKLEQGSRKIAVLGDMLELGEYSEKAHKDIGKLVAGIVDILITVGEKGKIIAKAAKNQLTSLSEARLKKDEIFSFDTAEEAAKAVKKIRQKGDIILVKASRGVGLEKVVERIIRN